MLAWALALGRCVGLAWELAWAWAVVQVLGLVWVLGSILVGSMLRTCCKSARANRAGLDLEGQCIEDTLDPLYSTLG